MSWMTVALITIVYLIFAAIIATFVGRRLAKMSAEFDEKWDESR